MLFAKGDFIFYLKSPNPLKCESLEIGEAYLFGSTENFLNLSSSSLPKYDQILKCTMGWFLKTTSNYRQGWSIGFRSTPI
jgi:hypothetical protein